MLGKTNAAMVSGGVIQNQIDSMKLDFSFLKITHPNGIGDTKGGMILPSENQYVTQMILKYDMGFIPSNLTNME